MTRGREGATGYGAVPSGAAAFTVQAACTWPHRVVLLMASCRFFQRWHLADASARMAAWRFHARIESALLCVNEFTAEKNRVTSGELRSPGFPRSALC